VKALALAAVVCAGAVAVPAASACSCLAPTTPRADLARSDGAIVGVYVGRYRASATRYLYTFRSVRSVKGRFPARFTVRSGTNSADCGLQVRRGQRIGLLLHRVGRRWTASLCDQRDPAFFRGTRVLLGRHADGCGAERAE
jgi:hypothetical protein